VHVGVGMDPAGSARFLRLDRSSLAWSMSAGPAGRALPAQAVWDARRRRLWYVTDGVLWSTDLESAPVRSATAELSPADLTGAGLLCLASDTGELVGVSHHGTAWSWSPDGATSRCVLDVPPSRASVHSLGRLPDGRALAGPFFGPGRLAVLADDAPVRTVPGPTQVDVIATRGSATLLGGYPGAGIYSAATHSPGPDPLVSPLLVLGREASGQDRTTALCALSPDDGHHDAAHHDAGGIGSLAVGTVPTYGRLGGKVVFVHVDRESGSVTHDELEPVRDQTVTALALHAGRLYGGTSPQGGLGSTPRRPWAHLFAIDLARRATLWSAPLPTACGSVGALLSLDAGLLVLTIEGDLLLLDPRAESVTTMLRTGLRAATRWGRRAALLAAADGSALGLSAGTLFRMDADLAGWQTLATGVHVVAAGPGDTVLVSDGTNVSRLSWM
jgi:hypothetical protein